ncbi:hypothetical protein [Bradyrhizobium japonicum]|uniref:hypothetical protein n=1 Tax=Bradyrhizobium japonicum TaxID=375 RepID=UPI0027149B8B|nr:hypothetical protein [Bradyrhizobium japonicum]WLB58471.1 hypothetical protein QIH94_21605 [Bradyrhizobium japonicum]WLB59731.1 hypothetical protein QIH96_24730 [Bradyrhizobium japonicum]
MSEVLSNYVPRKQAAEKLGNALRGKPYTEKTLIRWELEKYGPPVTRIGREVVYFWPSVEKWLREQEKAAA